MSLNKRIAVAVVLSLLLTTTAAGYEPHKVEPLPPGAFTRVEAPERKVSPVNITPNLHRYPFEIVPVPSPTPTPKPKVSPKPKPKKELSSQRVSGTISVRAGALKAKIYAARRMSKTQFDCLNALWRSESGWRWNALNRYSGAYGIPQAHPGSKMSTAGRDWRTNPITQVKWGLRYISGRYDTPCKAWRFKKVHGWY